MYQAKSSTRKIPATRGTWMLHWRRLRAYYFTNMYSPASFRLYSARTSLRTQYNALDEESPKVDPGQTLTEIELKPSFTHLTATGSAHMVEISDKIPSKRTATAVCSVHFSNATALQLIRENRAKKGDVLGVARIAGIMAAKRTADLIPLCHPIAITHVSVELKASGDPDGIQRHELYPQAPGNSTGQLSQSSVGWTGIGTGDVYKWPASGNAPRKLGPSPGEFGCVDIYATVSCDGKTGVEMEALTAASTAALTVYDMCKAVDKGMRIDGLRVVRKEGGQRGTWLNE